MVMMLLGKNESNTLSVKQHVITERTKPKVSIGL